ncbi:MAG: hypothetical protein KGJ93_01390 [Patescibacteria group bacterium]|nr:hypothetical protein [Patescibacteria group bacterium]
MITKIKNQNQNIANILSGQSSKLHVHLSAAQLAHLRSVSEIVLATVAVAGTVLLAAVAPNIFQAVDKLFIHKSRKKISFSKKKAKIQQAIYYLKRTGKIKVGASKGQLRVRLTNLGRKRVEEADFGSLAVPKPSGWNQKWWQVAADIPTKQYRQAADALRWKLKQMGFYSLQRTLWLYPYDPRRELQMVVDRFGVGRFVAVMEVSGLDKDDEGKMKRYFKQRGIL